MTEEQDKSEAATPHKLKEAQKRGQAAKSQEGVFAAVLAAFVLVLFSSGASIVRQELTLMQRLMHEANRNDWTLANTSAWLMSIVSSCLGILAPVFLAIVAGAILSNLAQVGPIFSFSPLSPNLDRINPISGLKRLFSLTLLYSALKNLLKLAALTWVLWVILSQSIPHLFLLNQVEAHAHGTLVMREVAPLLFKLLMVILVLALIDIGYARWDFGKKMRMSKREVKDEHKQREGDPRIRSRLRQLRVEFLKQSKALRRLPDADVLITNPTHLAIALSYRHGSMPAPRVLAKGAGNLAAKMRKVARRHHIPVVENPPLARAIYKQINAGAYLTEDLYPMTAKILLWVYSLRQSKQGARAAA
ncbi:MAG: EscU/YscU/HrcU family type III secretion system export apparatus switch protein [Burkholderiales bacterium]|nr:EscU/YscU/HrcU family type III secretion system export apparatus switch protein [Burkholderiales bacterium]